MSQVSIVDIEGNNPQIPTRFNANTGFAIPIANTLEILGTGGITTSGSGNTITIDGSSISRIETITGNVGGPITPIAGNIDLLTRNSTPKFVGTLGTQTLDFGISNLLLGSLGSSITTAQACVGLGLNALKSVVDGLRHTAIGAGALMAITGNVDVTAVGYQCLMAFAGANANTGVGSFCLTSCTIGGGNTAVGQAALGNITTEGLCTAMGQQALENATADSNCGFGYQSMIALTIGQGNTAIGTSCASSLVSGSYNLFLGIGAGQGYGTSESSNILLMNLGSTTESNTIRIGTQGSGAGEQNTAYFAGIVGNTVSNAEMVTINSATGQLGVQNIPVGKITSITIPGAYPYTTLATDEMIIVDSSSARTIIPMVAPVTGQTYVIKDSVGSAAVNNITITPSGHNIDGAASYIINSNYGSISIVYNGSEWSIF